ncbi:pseudouridylate synthase 4 [Desarmillaria tabescens]|uniref:tRNA pseudouridine(55) synthase n=1 Tax=Armillaria tabescens TaxID=1929756 RepID=A0AA39NE53_ARMTA|nr:pseudouridylate synthase 4 [Desarmillaria tabescens]KAK0463955.1 pseudouridylate synthase 4 [Desarmillaria tabescens]
MSVVNDIQALVQQSKLFVEASKLEQAAGKKAKGRKRFKGNVKIGQGGTLDPLADGVLVIGIGKGTKQLSSFLDCTKEYITTCLLGCETDSYDSEGAIVRTAPWKHIVRETVESKIGQFTGQIQQVPPIFSALKMDGKPLYEYARKGIPLPRPIEPRAVTIHSLELVEWLGSDHSFSWPAQKMSEEEKLSLRKAIQSVDQSVDLKDEPESTTSDLERPSAFVLKMKVSGGTYVRSIVHDLAHAVGRQGKFVLDQEEEDDHVCMPFEVFTAENSKEVDEEGWTRWEKEVMDHLQIVST